ncbi:YesL family protein [Amphibacillus jilinensis]|uniref:YesL family protein n=1 Tax=Amphibacillus jilinensis TaxID=1216008 RepID=UPI0002EBD80D|nr:DUF624 domain-containing protein [Amphibacillus jilinensis]
MSRLLFQLAEWITRLAYLNLLWLTFTFLGFVIFGFFPATISTFAIIRKWIKGQTDLPIFKTFWSIFRQEFIKANGYGLIISIVGGLSYTHLVFLSLHRDSNLLFVQFPLYLFLFFALLTLLYLFPVYVHYNLGFFTVIKQAFLLMLIHPLHNIAMLIGISLTIFVFNYIPGLTFFFAGSFIAFLLMGTCYQIFQSIEEKQQNRTAS